MTLLFLYKMIYNNFVIKFYWFPDKNVFKNKKSDKNLEINLLQLISCIQKIFSLQKKLLCAWFIMLNIYKFTFKSN